MSRPRKRFRRKFGVVGVCQMIVSELAVWASAATLLLMASVDQTHSGLSSPMAANDEQPVPLLQVVSGCVLDAVPSSSAEQAE
ncbi:MAG: hypothetical protein R3C03_24170 [Pirellulaceae bacterium]